MRNARGKHHGPHRVVNARSYSPSLPRAQPERTRGGPLTLPPPRWRGRHLRPAPHRRAMTACSPAANPRPHGGPDALREGGSDPCEPGVERFPHGPRRLDEAVVEGRSSASPVHMVSWDRDGGVGGGRRRDGRRDSCRGWRPARGLRLRAATTRVAWARPRRGVLRPSRWARRTTRAIGVSSGNLAGGVALPSGD